jgi:hypothetical protein
MDKLNNAMRSYLREPDTALLPYYDMVRGFMLKFDLKPEQAGRLLAQWVRETV